MDALDILALGLAAKGGGGGGTSDYSDLSNKPQINSVTLSGNKSLSDLGIPTYTAGDNVTISNNEISVEGLELEQDSQFVQGEVDKTNVSGGSVNLEQEVNGIYSKGLYLSSGATINGDDQTASKMFGLSTSRLWFEDYNSDRTVTIAPNDNYTGIKVRGKDVATTDEIPVPDGTTITESNGVWSAVGGGSAGAVRYDEAQTLSNAEFTQAMTNLQLGAKKEMKSKMVTGDLSQSYAIVTGQTGTLCRFDDWYSWQLPSSSSETYILEVTVDGETYSCEGYINQPTTNPYWYPNSGQTLQLGTIAKVINAACTGFVWLMYEAGATADATITDVKLYSKLQSLQITKIDSDLLPVQAISMTDNNSIVSPNITSAQGTPSVIISTDSNLTSTSYAQCAVGYANVHNYYDVAVGSNVDASGLNGSVAMGRNAFSVGNYSISLGDTVYTRGSDDSYPNVSNVFMRVGLGHSLYVPNDYCTIVGQNNANRTKLTYNAFNSSTTYSQGALVIQGGYIYESLQNSNQGHYPTSGQDTEYWKWRKDLQKTFIIADGVNNAHHDAVTFYADERAEFAGDIISNNIPACPSSDGTYTLQVVVSSGVPTYSWVAQS